MSTQKNSSFRNKNMKKYKHKKIARSTTTNTQSNSNNQTSKLCAFSSTDYIILASTLAIALGEELSGDDINILASFFAVLSDELALIASIDACNENEESPEFIPPIPDVSATTRCSNKKSKNKKQ